MAIKYEDLKKANEAIKTTDIKGRGYAEVNQRIKAFRMCYPDGFIKTRFFGLQDGICTMIADVGYYAADGSAVILGTGTAQEKETSSFINKTSYIENCETSAVGRALGMCGFGIDVSVASAEEVQNAIENQNRQATITEKEKKYITEMLTNRGYTVEEIFPKGLNLTAEQYTEAVQKISKMKAKGGKA